MTKQDFRQFFMLYREEIIDPDGEHVQYSFTGSELYELLQKVPSNVSPWIAYDFNKPETRPTEYGKYFVHRKDGKVHWETWNGSGWAYNGNVITHYQKINPPKQSGS